MVKNLRKSSILIVTALVFLYANLTGQYQKDVTKDAPPLTEHYVSLRGFE